MTAMSFRFTRRAALLRRLLAPVTGGALLAFAACSDAATAVNGQGTLSLHLTDAPGDFTTAVVTISEISLHGNGDRIILSDEPITTDLLTLVNSTQEIVDGVVVPEGTYRDLRFVITGAYIEVETADGGSAIYATSPDYEGLPDDAEVTGVLHTPSLAQSGLKVKLPSGGIIVGSEPAAMLVDFDVSRSFGRQAGNSGRWVMSPVIVATELEAAGSAVARVQLATPAPALPLVAGSVLTLADLSAVLTTADGSREEMKLTDADGDGVFEARFGFLIDGTYSLDLVGPAGVALTTAPARPAPVVVAAGGELVTAFTLSAATYTAPPTP